MTDYFQGLFAMGVPDTSAISIIPKPPAPVVAVVQRQPSKRTSPANQEPYEEHRHPGRCLKLASAAPAFGPKDKGLLVLGNPRDSTPFPRASPIYPGFICQGQQCPHPRGNCKLRHIFKPNPSNISLIEETGNHFLDTCKGWFYVE